MTLKSVFSILRDLNVTVNACNVIIKKNVCPSTAE